jgi:putative ABC transport system permease protein
LITRVLGIRCTRKCSRRSCSGAAVWRRRSNRIWPEIGIRLALGARPRDVVLMVLRSGAASVCGGLLVGMALALGVAAAVRSTVFGLDPRDPLVFTIVPLLLLMAATGAMWIPARRASAVDPVSSLRSQ